MRFLYNTLLYLLTPFLILRLLWRSRKNPHYRARLAERFGYFPTLPEPIQLWIHAVSVGETVATVPLVALFKQHYPQATVLITTTTPTGSARVRALYGNTVYHVYLPYDQPGAIKRFLNKVKPRLLVNMETELWPNLLYYTRQAQVPMLLANARLSAPSAAKYQRFQRVIQPMLQAITAVAAQSQADAERFMALGLAKNRVTVTGNLKFDLVLPEGLVAQGQGLRTQWGTQRLTWIAASTHAGEETLILAAFALLRQTVPNLFLILVPRHPERSEAVALLCQQADYALHRRSDKQDISLDCDILLGDTLGELLLLYAAADVAFVGGSLVATGGHNMLEPAALGLPIISGPHVFNFAAISELLLQAQALWFATTATELARKVLQLLQDQGLRQAAGARAQAVVASQQGAAQRQFQLLQRLYDDNSNA